MAGISPIAPAPGLVIPHQVPADLRITTHGFAGVKVHKQQYRLRSRNPVYSTSGGNNIMEFALNNDAFYKFTKGIVRFSVQIAVTGVGAAAWIEQGVWSLFKHMRIVVPSLLEEKRHQAKWTSLMRDVFCTAGVAITVGPMYGVDTLANRQAQALVNFEYAMPIDFDLISHQVMPLSLSKNTTFILQWELAPTNESLAWAPGTTSATVTITNPLLEGEQLLNAPIGTGINQSTATPDYYKYVYDQMVSYGGVGMPFGFKEVEFFQSNAITGTSAQIPIQQRARSVDAVIVRLQLEGFDTNPANLDKFLTSIKGTGGVNVSSAQLKRNNVFYPQEPVDYSGRALEGYHTFQKWAGKWNKKGVFINPTPISLNDYNTDRFLMIFEINPFAQDHLVSNESTAASNVDMTLEIRFDGVLPATLRADIFVIYYENVMLRMGNWERSK